MKIKNFKMKVTPEQSKIVQNILFKNGYFWYSDKVSIIRNLDYKYILCNRYDNDVKKIYCLISNDIESFENEKDYKELTFDDFMNQYSLKRIRKNKLQKIYEN